MRIDSVVADEVFRENLMSESLRMEKEVGTLLHQNEFDPYLGEKIVGETEYKLKEISDLPENTIGLFHTHIVGEETDFELASNLSFADIEIAEEEDFEVMYLGVIDPATEKMRLLKFTPDKPNPSNAFTGWKESVIWENFES